MKTAVALLLFDPHGAKVLAINRRDNPNLWGLPGGKVDFGESNVEAALREMREETGVNLFAPELIPIYTEVCPGAVNYWCTTYLCDARVNPGSLRPEEGLSLDWFWPEELSKRDISPFANYNSRAFMAFTRFKELS
jgi:8-oxo-dGTP pyrophosphatase MutT (NUDIX family)